MKFGYRHLFVIMLAAWSPWFIAALQSWTAGTYEASPANSDQISLGDDNIRELKENIRLRAQVENLWGTAFAGGDNGRSREGSARAFYEAACPTALSNSATDTAGSTAIDDGRICRDSATGELKVASGAGTWVAAVTKFVTPISITGSIDLLGTSAMTNDGADSMDVHAHKARHRLGGSNGAWAAAADGIPFAIQQVLADTSWDATCNTVSTTALASQVFGDAGAACLSIPAASGLNFTGRGTSRLLVYGSINVVDPGVQCQVYANIYLDSMAAPIAVTSIFGSAFGSGLDNLSVMGYISTVTAASHEIAMHISDSADDGCTATDGSLYVIDLGSS